jgi:capsular polysaccharide biosynthesis protein
VRTYDEPAFLLAGPHDCGFGDWIINFPPRLMLAEAARLDAKIVVSDQAIASAEPMLAALGVNPSRLIRHDTSGVSLFPRLYAPSWPMRLRLNHMPDPFAIYRRAARAPGSERPRLYLSREGVGRRRMLNEPQVRALFERRGFRTIQPERMSFEETLELFAGPSLVAAPYGSALLNLAFASTKPPCLVIAPPEPESFLLEAISWLGAMELPFGYVRGEPAPDGWTAPLELVEAGLEALLGLEG